MEGKWFVEPDDVPTQVFDWGTVKWMGDPRITGGKALSMCIALLEPGKGHALHTHPGVEEFLYFISGTGVQVIAGERREVKPGSLVFIPPGVEHETMNTGWEPLKFAAVYTPPVPDLTDNPECRLVPAGQPFVR